MIRLDSGGNSPWASWSCIAGPATMTVRAEMDGRTCATSASGDLLARWDNPLDALRWMESRLDPAPASSNPPPQRGWIGWIGYDLGRWFEELPCRAVDDLRLPLMQFTWHDDVASVGCASAHRPPEATGALIPQENPATCGETSGVLNHTPPSNFTRNSYEAAVARTIEYIAAGDIFQVNLSQRFTAPLRRNPRDIYQRLSVNSPAWFGAYLEYDDYALLCNSPELFLRVTRESGRRRVITRPIKGTRPRGAQMAAELQASIKDQAELNMIVDLERNDLGRVCRIGSVKVTEPRVIEEHPTVYHGAATIEGILRDDVGLVALLAATFPGGSITGAPKIRAMQIIDELEPTRRGPYCGAIGYIAADGHMQFNIAIRTMIATRGQIHIPVGGGIVADSTPAAEYEETLVKARAMFAAIDAQ